MTLFQKRQYERMERSIGFIDQHREDFSPSSKALSLRDELKEIIAQFDATGQQKVPGKSVRSSTSAKLKALNALREDLVAIARSAEVIEQANDGFNNTFILPDRRRKNELADAARQFIRDAQPYKQDFKALEMNDDFLEQLQERLDTFEATQTGKAKETKEGDVSTDPLNELSTRGSKTLDVLDVIMMNKYRGQGEVLAAWKDTSKLEFTPRRKKGEKASDHGAKK